MHNSYTNKTNKTAFIHGFLAFANLQRPPLEPFTAQLACHSPQFSIAPRLSFPSRKGATPARSFFLKKDHGNRAKGKTIAVRDARETPDAAFAPASIVFQYYAIPNGSGHLRLVSQHLERSCHYPFRLRLGSSTRSAVWSVLCCTL